MPRPKPDFTPVAIMVRVSPELAAWVDDQRGEQSRSDWIRARLQAMKPPAGSGKPAAEMSDGQRVINTLGDKVGTKPKTPPPTARGFKATIPGSRKVHQSFGRKPRGFDKNGDPIY